MTLNTRNRLFKILSIASASLLGLLVLTAVIRLAAGYSMALPETDYSSIKGPVSFMFTQMAPAGLISSAAVLMYAISASFIVRYSFEKTQSPEITYFFVFLIGCMCELFTMLIPVFALTDSYCSTLIFVSRGAFAGRLITVFSFLFASLFSKDTQVQEADRNAVITIIIAVLFAAIVPIDSRTLYPSLSVATGFSLTFTHAKGILCIITFLTLFFTGKRLTGIGYLLLYGGYAVLITGATPFSTILGILWITIGSKIYLNEIHNYYLWK